MDFQKNKMNIIAVVALIVVCGGSFLGVRAMSNRADVGNTVPSVYEIESIATTTAAPTTTEAPTTTTTTSPFSTEAPVADSTASVTLKIESVITTFPVSSVTTTEATTTTEVTTTETTTTETTTTEPTTERTTAPKVDNTTTTKKSSSNGGILNGGGIFSEGLAGYQYNTGENFYYTSSDPWQRALGYHEIFDVGAGLVSIYIDTMRLKFEYADKDWMIQFWKGQYGMVFVGHEIGVYTKPKTRTNDHYDAASNEDALYMELTGYRKGEEIYHRDYAKYWWCTGFVPGTLDNLMDRSELSLKCRITMKDYDMLKGVVDALKENGMVAGKNYAVDGLDVLVTW